MMSKPSPPGMRFLWKRLELLEAYARKAPADVHLPAFPDPWSSKRVWERDMYVFRTQLREATASSQQAAQH